MVRISSTQLKPMKVPSFFFFKVNAIDMAEIIALEGRLVKFKRPKGKSEMIDCGLLSLRRKGKGYKSSKVINKYTLIQ